MRRATLLLLGMLVALGLVALADDGSVAWPDTADGGKGACQPTSNIEPIGPIETPPIGILLWWNFGCSWQWRGSWNYCYCCWECQRYEASLLCTALVGAVCSTVCTTATASYMGFPCSLGCAFIAYELCKECVSWREWCPYCMDCRVTPCPTGAAVPF